MWVIAWVLALALHAGGILGFRSLPLLHSSPVRSREPEPIQLVFSSPGPETRRTEEPQFFSELPPNRADVAPRKAGFLSNVTSRARDLVPGGDAALPQMHGEGDAPMVGLEPHETPPPSSAAAVPAPQPSEPAAPRTVETPQPSDAPTLPQNAGSAPAVSKPTPARPATDAAKQGIPGPAGDSDTYQPEMDNPDGNAGLTGDVSLNTTAWDYAPWLQRYSRQLMRRWYAPPAYWMGLLKEGGWAVIEAEISPSGQLLRSELLEEQGHPSLILSAQSAVRAVAPIEPLPAGFPEPTLILRIRMIYPKFTSPETPRSGRYAPGASRHH